MFMYVTKTDTDASERKLLHLYESPAYAHIAN